LILSSELSRAQLNSLALKRVFMPQRTAGTAQVCKYQTPKMLTRLRDGTG
jgi:hypothetical protein